MEKYIKTVNTLSGGIFSSTTDWMDWATFLIGVLFALLGIWLIWIYFSKKPEYEESKRRVEDKSPWSFVGFWGRYKGNIFVFFGVALLLIAFVFVLMGAIGYEPPEYVG